MSVHPKSLALLGVLSAAPLLVAMMAIDDFSALSLTMGLFGIITTALTAFLCGVFLGALRPPKSFIGLAVGGVLWGASAAFVSALIQYGAGLLTLDFFTSSWAELTMFIGSILLGLTLLASLPLLFAWHLHTGSAALKKQSAAAIGLGTAAALLVAAFLAS